MRTSSGQKSPNLRRQKSPNLYQEQTRVGCYEECKTVMQSSGMWGKTHATAGIHVRLCEKAPSRFSSGKPLAYRPQVCLWKNFWELSHKAFSHGSLPGHVFYLTYLRPASLFIPDLFKPYQFSTVYTIWIQPFRNEWIFLWMNDDCILCNKLWPDETIFNTTQHPSYIFQTLYMRQSTEQCTFQSQQLPNWKVCFKVFLVLKVGNPLTFISMVKSQTSCHINQ